MREDSIKMLVQAMCEVGSAAQTLGGVLKASPKSTYASVSKIALGCRLPVKTVRNHLKILSDNGWITNQGRQPTRTGRARRTCTISVTEKTTSAMTRYCPLPWWVQATKWNWRTRALWSVIVCQWLKLRVGILEALGERTCSEPMLPDHLDLIGGDERFGFSLSDLQKMTGLTTDSIVEAKRDLYQGGFVIWAATNDHTSPDVLMPNWDMNLIIERVSDDTCTIRFAER